MIAYVVAPGGAHKGFLNYFLDRYSALTPKITELPFGSNGTSHNENMLSGQFKSYHPSENPPYFTNTDLPHILVTVSIADILFLERIINLRGADLKQNVNKDYIQFKEDYIKKYNLDTIIKKLFDKDIDNNTKVPKCVFRDIKKLMFLDPTKNGFITKQNQYKKHLPNKTYHFPLSAIWHKENFFKEIKKLNNYLDLQITLDDTADMVFDTFTKNIKEWGTKDRILKVIDALEKKQNFNLETLDTVEQAYLSAYIEKNNNYVTVPFTNGFFKDTNEIQTWLNYYPQHYKAMNPNLPTFNNIPNPFHLWNLKK